MDTRGQGRQKEGKEKLPPQNHFQPGTSPTFHMLPGAWQEVEGMGEEVDAGCIVWMDENGIAWCLDTFGVYGTAGAVSMLSDGHWVNHSGQHDDGCIQWVDVHGVRWSRDVMGVYGPSSAEYYSEDGVTWFGQGEGWLELGDEAAEYFAACGMRKVRLAEHSRKMGGAAARPRWENEKGLLHLQVPAGHGDREIGVGGLIGPGRVVSEQDRLYGGMLAEVRELEARVNSAFDAVVEELTPVVWPEMALRF